MIGLVAIAAIASGTLLAVTGYSSAGAFAVASACVGVLGTLVGRDQGRREAEADRG